MHSGSPSTDAVLDRVRKLLALSTSSNVHEAAAAAGRAQALIARHRLEGWLAAEAAVEDDPVVDARDAPLEVSRRLRKWKVVLACELADANGCVAYTLQIGRDRALVLVGRDRDRAAVTELWGWLVKRVEWLSATHGAGHDKRWHEAFRMGAAVTIGERLAATGDEVRGELEASALAVLDPAAAAYRAAVDRFVADRLQLRPGRAIRVDADAWERGRVAGSEVDLGR